MAMLRGLFVLLVAAPLLAKPVPPLRTAPTAQGGSANVVNCAKGDSIQSAVDKAPVGGIVEVHGVCAQNVVIEKKLTLRGTDPAVDQIQGTAANVPAVVVRNADATLDSLSISNGVAAGVGVRATVTTITNCRMEHNAGRGLDASFGAFVSANNVTLAFNDAGLVARNGAEVFCVACHAEGNTKWAAQALNGGLFSYLRSEVIGARGIEANGGGSYGDIDCINDPSPHPCSMNATLTAAHANDGTVALLEAGDFKGSLTADSGGTVGLIGARQDPTGSHANGIDGFSRLTLEMGDTGASRLVGSTVLSAFSRALIRAGATLAGSITCTSASDAWLDPGTREPGSSVSGCPNAP